MNEFKDISVRADEKDMVISIDGYVHRLHPDDAQFLVDAIETELPNVEDE